MDHALERESRRRDSKVTFNTEARRRYLEFATAPAARWTRNFRDLNGSVARMATLASSGRIDRATVEAEVERLERTWKSPAPQQSSDTIDPRDRPYPLTAKHLGEQAEDLDLFDRVQLEQVLHVCANSKSLSEAGRVLFEHSQRRRTSTNDADRLRKYLTRFGIEPRAVT